MSTVDQYLVWPIFHMMCVHHPTMILHTGMVFCVTNIYTGYHNNDGVQLKFYGNCLQKKITVACGRKDMKNFSVTKSSEGEKNEQQSNTLHVSLIEASTYLGKE